MILYWKTEPFFADAQKEEEEKNKYPNHKSTSKL